MKKSKKQEKITKKKNMQMMIKWKYYKKGNRREWEERWGMLMMMKNGEIERNTKNNRMERKRHEKNIIKRKPKETLIRKKMETGRETRIKKQEWKDIREIKKIIEKNTNSKCYRVKNYNKHNKTKQKRKMGIKNPNNNDTKQKRKKKDIRRKTETKTNNNNKKQKQHKQSHLYPVPLFHPLIHLLEKGGREGRRRGR